jgi:hypothetical protein
MKVANVAATGAKELLYAAQQQLYAQPQPLCAWPQLLPYLWISR